MIAAALALNAAAALVSTPPAEPLTALPDDRGAFAEVVLHAEPSSLDAVRPTYEDLLRALAPSTRVTLAVPDEAAERRVREALAGATGDPARLRVVRAGKPITTWSRDRYTLLEGTGRRPVLLVPPRIGAAGPARANDWEVPFLLAKEASGEVRVAPFHFDGGDLLVTRERVYATAALLAKNVGITVPDRAALLRLLERTLGRPALILGERAEEVPDHHICMILTPLPDGRVAVGDVREGAAWARRLAIPDADASDATARRFDAVAAALERAGVGVVRVPLVPLRAPRVYVTYQNGIIEERGGASHLYMPTYGHDALDRHAARAFEAAGFVVHAVRAEGIFRDQGSVRCLVNVLARKEA
jgi:hypothetical protein